MGGALSNFFQVRVQPMETLPYFSVLTRMAGLFSHPAIIVEFLTKPGKTLELYLMLSEQIPGLQCNALMGYLVKFLEGM